MPDVHAVLENVTYTHWNQTEPTLRNVNLSFDRGTLTLLAGPGGSGKSTLAGLFNGSIPHLLGGTLSGRVLVDGVDSADRRVCDLARSVGHLFQDPESMFATLYVEDEVAFGPENLNEEPEAIRATVASLLSETGLESFRRNLVWNLSGGQIQKLSLAAVLALKPTLVVLDEPTANLDPLSTMQVHEIAAGLVDKGCTVILITRELDEFLLDRADRIVVLKDGSVLVDAPVREALDCRGSELVELGVRLPETAEISAALLGAGDGRCADFPYETAAAYEALKSRGLLGTELRSARAGGGSDGRESPGAADEPPRSCNPGEILIGARELRFSYPGMADTLKGVSFDVRAGELLALVGRNGAGKSTLSKLLVGLLKPSAGELELFGKGAKKWKVPSLAEHVSLVFQNPEHQFLTDSVRDEIAYSLSSRGVADEGEIASRTDEALARMELDAFAALHPFALSAGMKRRLGVATMLVGNPRVLIVDEPTYGQDARMTRTLMSILEDFRSRGTAILMITHDMRLVQEYADRVIVLNEGRIGFDGAPADLFASGDLLSQARLRPTQLWEFLARFRAEGGRTVGSFKTIDDFIAAIGGLSHVR